MSVQVQRYVSVAAVILAFVLVFFALLPALVGRDATRDHSVFRKNPWGCAALAELCRRATPPLHVEPLTRPLDDLKDVAGALLIIDAEKPFSPSELTALVNWVEAGGTLIVAFEGEWEDSARVELDAEPGYAALAEACGIELTECSRRLEYALPALSSPLSHGVIRVGVQTSYCLEAAPEITGDSAPLWKARGFTRSRLTPHLMADGKLILGSRRHGRGEIFLSSDAAMFSNEMLSREDNLQFLANLLWPRARGGALYFDEYHHGFGFSKQRRSDVDPTPLRRAVWVAVIGVAIFLMGKAQRFGEPVPAFDRRRRAAMEYVEAFAGLFRRGEANNWALNKIATDVRQRLALAVGLPPSAGAEAIALRLEQRRVLPRQQTLRVLGEVEAALQREQVSYGRLLDLVNRLCDLEDRARLTGPTRISLLPERR